MAKKYMPRETYIFEAEQMTANGPIPKGVHVDAEGTCEVYDGCGWITVHDGDWIFTCGCSGDLNSEIRYHYTRMSDKDFQRTFREYTSG